MNISPLQKMGLKLGVNVAGDIVKPAAKGLMGLSAGIMKSAGIGAAIGGIKGAITGDNYDSTSTLRNVATGAIGGAAVGATARFLMSRSGIKGVAGTVVGAARLAGQVLPVAGRAAGTGLKAAGFLANHPGLAFAGAAVVGGGMYMGGAFNNRFNDMEAQDMESNGSVTSRGFQNSAVGLTQALSRRRHGNR